MKESTTRKWDSLGNDLQQQQSKLLVRVVLKYCWAEVHLKVDETNFKTSVIRLMFKRS